MNEKEKDWCDVYQTKTLKEKEEILLSKTKKLKERLDEFKAPQPRGSGTKYDEGKPDLTLLSRVWLLGVAKVLGFGVHKYGRDNWRQGITQTRLLAAALRHIFAFAAGESLDPETGLCHLDHASCMVMFARELWETSPQLDDRTQKEERK